MAMFAKTIGHLAARWSSARPLLPGFALLAQGEPLPVARLAEATGASIAELNQVLEKSRSDRDEKGNIIDLFGMSLRTGPMSLQFGKATVHACCGLWALMIPTLVNRTAEVCSADPVSGDPVRIVVSPGRIESVEPSGAAATMASASARDIAADISAAFCTNVRYFRSRKNAAHFAKESFRRRVVELDELRALGQSLFHAIWTQFEK